MAEQSVRDGGGLKRLRNRFVPVALAAMVIAGASACGASAASPRPRDLSALPACAAGDSPSRLLAPAKLPGPAAGSVSDGRIRKGWSLDGGALTVAPVAGGQTPALPEQQAACNLLASITPNGRSLPDIAPLGSVLGYGRLTVASNLPHVYSQVGNEQVHSSPTVFKNRLAWILAVNFSPPSSCPAMIGPASPAPSSPSSGVTPSARPLTYQVYAVDATTGTDAITFIAKRPGGCGGPPDPATSAVPYQAVSVPWRNQTIGGDNGLGSLEARYANCETVSLDGAWVDRERPQVQVSVLRRVGNPCGPSSWHRVTLHPGLAGDTIPARLSHAPTGPIDRVPGDS
jgi:hypothetical protein